MFGMCYLEFGVLCFGTDRPGLIKGFFEMNNLFYLFPFDQNADDVKPNEKILRVVADKCLSGTLDEPLFAAVYGLFREAKIKIRPRLYLHDHGGIVLQSNNIDLLFATPPVTMKYNITFI